MVGLSGLNENYLWDMVKEWKLKSLIENILKGISGLNNAGRSNNGIRRIVWMVIFLVGMAGTLHSVYVVVKEIMEYPVDTTVTITTDTSVRRSKSDEY